MNTGLTEKLIGISESLRFIIPELTLCGGIITVLLAGLIFNKSERRFSFHLFAVLLFSYDFLFILIDWSSYTSPVALFNNMIRSDDFSAYMKLLFDVAGILTVIMTWQNPKPQKHIAEYYALLFSVVLGAHLLAMSLNFVMVFISIELISISSYVLAGFAFDRRGAEGSLKYFLFGSVASAVMLYGMSILYGLTGTLDYSSGEFVSQLIKNNTPLMLTAGLMTLAGFLYKIAAAPMHPWAPDIYEASPMPVVAFFSVVPKLAGIAVLVKLLLALNLFGNALYDWQLIISVVAILTLTVGNFSALMQKIPKRMMAYSSIAQSGFLLIGIAAFTPQGTHVMLFYATIYTVANFLVFVLLQYFESHNIHTIAAYAGVGKFLVLSSIMLLIGFITLTGLPPTSGFTGKLFIFSSLWEAYGQSGKPILLWLLIFGLLNTVVALFYYIKIPYYAFLKSGEHDLKINSLSSANFLAFILVVVILILFFLPGLLMGWINKINFVL